MARIPQIGETISAEEFNRLPEVGETISAEQFEALPETPQWVPFVSGAEEETKKASLLSRLGSGVVNVADFLFPIKIAAKQITPEITTLISPEYRKLTKQGIVNPELERPSEAELVGAGARGLLTAATGRGIGTQGNLLQRTLTGGALGGGFITAGSLEKKGKLPTKMELGIGVGVGVALPLIGALVRLVGREVVEKLPNSIMRTVAKQSVSELKSGKDISEFALENKKIGTTTKLLRDSLGNQDILENQIDSLLGESEEVVKKNNIFQLVVEKINKEGGGPTITKKNLEETLLRVAPQAKGYLSKDILSVQEANKFRSLLDRTALKQATFLRTQEPAFTGELVKDFTNILRDVVQNKVEATAPLFEEWSKEITFYNAVRNTSIAAGRRVFPLSLSDIGVLLGGGVTGHPIVGGTLLISKRIAQSNIGKTLLAVGGKQAIESLETILPKLAPAEQMVILNLLRKVPSSSFQNMEQPIQSLRKQFQE